MSTWNNNATGVTTTSGHSATCTAFAGTRRIASGNLADVARATKTIFDQDEGTPVLIFDDLSSEPVEIDFRGTVEDVVARLAEAPRAPGRPRLGVVAREVTLLPRHWDWLNGQPGGASSALRRLVDEARRTSATRDRVRVATEAAYRFMAALAGNEPGFEESTRALFAGNHQKFNELSEAWPTDVREHARMLVDRVFDSCRVDDSVARYDESR
jgi:hypothetical protein